MLHFVKVLFKFWILGGFQTVIIFLLCQEKWIKDKEPGSGSGSGWPTECQSFPPSWALGVNFQRGGEMLGKSLKFAWQPTRWTEYKRSGGILG